MRHVCGFTCSLCVELKLMINTRSLSNQVLKSAHPQLLSSRCWPWGVFIGAGQPLQHGEVRGINLAWVRPVVRTCLKSNEVDTFDLLPQWKIDAVLSVTLLKMNSTFYWNAPLRWKVGIILQNPQYGFILQRLASGKYICLLDKNTKGERNMKWFSKFVYSTFDKRSKFHSSPS